MVLLQVDRVAPVEDNMYIVVNDIEEPRYTGYGGWIDDLQGVLRCSALLFLCCDALRCDAVLCVVALRVTTGYFTAVCRVLRCCAAPCSAMPSCAILASCLIPPRPAMLPAAPRCLQTTRRSSTTTC